MPGREQVIKVPKLSNRESGPRNFILLLSSNCISVHIDTILVLILIQYSAYHVLHGGMEMLRGALLGLGDTAGDAIASRSHSTQIARGHTDTDVSKTPFLPSLWCSKPPG